MQALSDFSRALQCDPWNKVDILNFTGTIKFRNGDAQSAGEDIVLVLQKNTGLLNDLVMQPEEYELLQKLRG